MRRKKAAPAAPRQALIVGVDGAARSLCDRLVHQHGWEIQGFIADAVGRLLDRPVYDLGRPETIPPHLGLVLGWERPARREEYVRRLGPERFLTVIIGYVSAFSRVGRGCVIMGTVFAESTLGDFVHVNEDSAVGHHCLVGDYTFIGAKFCGGGGGRMGRRNWTGLGVTTAPRIAIGDDVGLGDGAVVTGNIGPGRDVTGHPAAVKGEAETSIFTGRT